MDELIENVGINAKHSNEDQIAPFPVWAEKYGDKIVAGIDCKDGFVVLVDLFERETRVEGRLLTIDLVGNTAIIVKD